MATPSDQYSDRLRQREALSARFDRDHQRLGSVRLALGVVFLGSAWAAIGAYRASPGWILLPAALFVATVVYHQRVKRLRAQAQRAVQFYRAGLERLQGRWTGRGLPRVAPPLAHHIYGDDLDLFGDRSLYSLLSTARTVMGESLLATWLLEPAALTTIRERQDCIRDLRDRLDLREALSVSGEPAVITLHPQVILDWAAAPQTLDQPGLAALAATLVTGALATALIWSVWDTAAPLIAVLIAEVALTYVLRERVQKAIAAVEHAYEDIRLLAALLRRIESESFAAAPLQALQAQLASQSRSASAALAKLATIVNLVESRRNPLLAPLLLPLLYPLHTALAAERWRRAHGGALATWLSVLGEFEALMSIAGYSFDHPDDPFPEFLEGAAAFRAVALGHPLIPAATRVRNDVVIAGETRILLVSGSNMSGKSTLLRSVGMNAVLAMAGAPVCAARLQLTPLAVAASIRVNDSLHEGSSRFYAEITRLRQLFEPSPLPLLFLLDELLQGTNSTDRRIGAQGVVRALIERGGIGLISTHDLALTDIPGLDSHALRNVHFQDELRDGKLTFDFALRDGVVTKSNGIELMRSIGLDV